MYIVPIPLCDTMGAGPYKSEWITSNGLVAVVMEGKNGNL
jgi:hypothetical protein